MAKGRIPFDTQSTITEILRASSGLQDAFVLAQGGTAASLVKMLRVQETMATHMSILSQSTDARSEPLNAARGLQSSFDAVTASYLMEEQELMRASVTMAESLRFADSLATYERALETAVHQFAEKSLKDGTLGRVSPIEYAWELALRQGESRGITDYLSTARKDNASLVSDLIESCMSSLEYSTDGTDAIEYPAARSVSRTDDNHFSKIETAATQSKAIEAVVSSIAASPLGFRRGQTDEYRIALVTLYLSLVFGLMDHVRWYLDNVERQREAAQSAKEKSAFVEQKEQAVQAVDSLNRSLRVLLEQAIAKEICVVGERSATVRSLPGSGLKLGTAYTNQQVLVTDKSTRWVKIRFRDHLEAREVEGWMLKHYLQPMGQVDCGLAATEAHGK